VGERGGVKKRITTKIVNEEEKIVGQQICQVYNWKGKGGRLEGRASKHVQQGGVVTLR